MRRRRRLTSVSTLRTVTYATPRRIDLDAVDTNRLLVFLAAADRLARPAQQRPRTRHELADAERLGQIVVGAALEPDDLVRLIPPRRQHENRYVAVRRAVAHRAAERQAVEARNHRVEDEQVESLALGALQRLPAIADGFASVA